MRKILFILATLFLVLLAVGVVGSFFYAHHALSQNADQLLLPPSADWWFGTDSLGRDLFARVLLGARVSLFVGLVCSVLAGLFGFFFGAIAGWNRGWVDRAMMRFCDILTALPSFILVSVLVLSFNLLLPVQDSVLKSFISLCLGICSTHWMNMARVSRGLVLETLNKPYVEAAVALGASPARIILQHILPNILNTLLIMMALQIPVNMVYESFMSFIGLGVHPPLTSWGILVREGWRTLSVYPHILLFPSLVLFLTVWSLHVFVDHFKR